MNFILLRMKVIIEVFLSDYIESKLQSGYHRCGECFRQGALFISRLYSCLKELGYKNMIYEYYKQKEYKEKLLFDCLKI